MKGEDLPANDHIVRYVKPTMIEADGSADGADFKLRATRPEETGLSVNWLEAFEQEKAGQLNEVRRLIRLRMRPSGRFAELNVGTVLRVVSEELDTLRIVHDPLAAEGEHEADSSHAEFTGLPSGDTDKAALVGDLIAQCVVAMHPAVVRREG